MQKRKKDVVMMNQGLLYNHILLFNFSSITGRKLDSEKLHKYHLALFIQQNFTKHYDVYLILIYMYINIYI